ncbi:hypothetical protein P8452_19580 [Trifolium repens]|nr:hypothetical protein P8452_19580 [Trifolium repens]
MKTLRKHASVIILFLIVLLAFTSNVNKVSATSGGVAGGSFFDSDSSDSFTSDSNSEYEKNQYHTHDSSYSQYANEDHHMYNSPSLDAADEHPSGVNGPIVFFMVFTVGLFAIGFYNNNKEINGNSVTVLKLQVGVLGDPGCTIQSDLTRIADAADTSSKAGVSNLLTETLEALDQHLSYVCGGYSSVDIKRSNEDGQKCYNQQSIEEREKFDEETLVNLDNNNKTRIRSQSSDSFSNEEETMFEKTLNTEKEKLLTGANNKYIVITLLVAAKGAHKLPTTIDDPEDFKEASEKIKSLLSDKLLAGEVLWTPQKEEDTLIDRKLFKDYPELSKSSCRGMPTQQGDIPLEKTVLQYYM